MSVLAGGTLAQNGDGRLEVFVRGDDNAVWHIWQTAPNNGWSGWASLGGNIPVVPVVFPNADLRVEVFARGVDNALWHIWQTAPNNAWSGRASLGGNFPGQPAVWMNADGRLEVFVRGDDNALWHIWQTAPNNGWSGWASLGGSIPGQPAVFHNEDGRLEAFARGDDNALWHIWQTAPNNGWSGWASLGGNLPGDPVVFQNQDARAEVFARGDDGALWHIWQTAPNNGWSGWASLGGNIPALTAQQPAPVSPAAPSPPPASSGPVMPPTDSSSTSTALAQEQAKAAQQGYYDPGCVVTYQGAQYTVVGVSIGYTNNVPHVNGEDLQPVGGGPIVNLVPYSALTLVAPPPPTTPPPSPSRQPAPPPPPPNQDRADPGHVFGINQNSIQSPHGQFWLEAPGIFVLQDAAGNHKWESPYNGAPANGGCSGEMQTDGNLVAYAYYIYGGGAGTAKNPTWASGTQGNPGAYLLIDWQTYTAKVMSPDGTTVLWHS